MLCTKINLNTLTHFQRFCFTLIMYVKHTKVGPKGHCLQMLSDTMSHLPVPVTLSFVMTSYFQHGGRCGLAVTVKELDSIFPFDPDENGNSLDWKSFLQ